MSRLLISDANILIDLEDGNLLNELFKLPFQFQVPDMLYVDELADNHSHLLNLGLQLGELTPESIAEVTRLVQKYKKPSRYDCMALALAKQDSCTLLTGDGKLRKAAELENVEFKGTLWIVETMISYQLITVQLARIAYQDMKKTGRRLPWELAERRLADIEASL